MQPSKSCQPILKHSIVWAALILAITYILSSHSVVSSVNSTILIFLIGGWYISQQFLLDALGKSSSLACEVKFFKRMLDKSSEKNDESEKSE